MLILTRRIGECVTIGDHIKVYVIDIKGRQVRLGIEAPSDTMVFRKEVYQRIAEENQLASKIEIGPLDQMIEGKE